MDVFNLGLSKFALRRSRLSNYGATKTCVTTQSGPNSVSPSKSDLAQSRADNIAPLEPFLHFCGRRKKEREEEEREEKESKKQRALLAS